MFLSSPKPASLWSRVVPLPEADVVGGEKLGTSNDEMSVPDDFDTLGAANIEPLFEGKAP